MAKKRKKKGSKIGRKKQLKTVAPVEYVLRWDMKSDQCHFGHQSGIGGEIGSGMGDMIEVFYDGEKYYVLSLNYTAPYASLEAFVDEKGAQSIIFAEPKDVEKLFGSEISKVPPKEVAEKLASMLK